MFFCTTHCFLGPKAKPWCLDVRQSIPFSLNIRCFVLFMPKLCFIHDLFLLSNFIMHALFVFTKCILHPSGWLKQVFFNSIFILITTTAIVPLSTDSPLPLCLQTYPLHYFIPRRPLCCYLFFFRLECECCLVLYLCIYLFFQSHYHI